MLIPQLLLFSKKSAREFDPTGILVPRSNENPRIKRFSTFCEGGFIQH